MLKIIGKREVEMLDKKKCDVLVNKAKTLNKAPILSAQKISQLEQKLQVILPNDFKYINNQYDYEYICYFDFYSFPIGNTEETLFYRNKHKLGNNYIVLFWDGAFFVILYTISSEKSQVIWCNSPDFFNLCDGKPMEYKPTIFQSFTDFFEFLLDEEEKSQAEDAELNNK